MSAELRVVATAGHVDHGKSSLISQLTGMDPDRWAEEKRRGLTIDLGYAWCTLPSGREIGFVDVPGHERFIGNMLAGVGPVRLVLFVVAADEGWKPQSEEHLQILDVLGVQGGVVALTKQDLVDEETLALAEEEIRERLAGTALMDAPIVPVSSGTGYGVDELMAALDAMVANVRAPEIARPRLFVDRVFLIRGAGTVVTGTLAGDCIAVGDEMELYPTGEHARIRSLQTHRRGEERACPVSRVAANLVGAERETLERGVVAGRPGEWAPTRTFEGTLRSVRGLSHAITSRGAFKVYIGAAESEARLRLYGTSKLEPGDESFVRLTVSHPLVLDVGDRFVLREAGRHETIGGGLVLDVAPPARPERSAPDRLAARAAADRDELVPMLVGERGALPASEAELLTGSRAIGGIGSGRWLVSPAVRDAVDAEVVSILAMHHREHPHLPGIDLAAVRRGVTQTLRAMRAPTDAGLVEALLVDISERDVAVRDTSSMRSPSHVESEAHAGEIDRLLAEIGGDHETSPPDLPALRALGIDGDVIEAAARSGAAVRISPDLLVTSAFVERANDAIEAAGGRGITVSAFREALGTTRKYAVPLLEWFDRRGLTRREGDVRVARNPTSPKPPQP